MVASKVELLSLDLFESLSSTLLPHAQPISDFLKTSDLETLPLNFTATIKLPK